MKRLKKISIIPAFLLLCISHGITAQDTLTVRKADDGKSSDTLVVEKKRKADRKTKTEIIRISDDSVKVTTKPTVKRKGDTMKASMLSAVLPGAGQIYNRKYWKLPLVYAGFGGLIYSFSSNSTNYQMYYRGYLDFTDKIKETQSYKKFMPENSVDYELHPESFDPASAQLLKEKTTRLMDYHKRYRDLSIILTGVWYFAQILDANVDASLSDYDVSDNLQLSFYPSLMTVPGQFTASTLNVKLTWSF